MMVGPCWRHRAEPLMARFTGHRLHAAPLNRVVVVRRHSWFFGIIVAKASGSDDRRRLLHPASYSVSIQFRQSRFCIRSQYKRQTGEDTPCMLTIAGVHSEFRKPKLTNHSLGVTLKLVMMAA